MSRALRQMHGSHANKPHPQANTCLHSPCKPLICVSPMQQHLITTDGTYRHIGGPLDLPDSPLSEMPTWPSWQASKPDPLDCLDEWEPAPWELTP